MYWFTESELAQELNRFKNDQEHIPWFWYRDVILHAQERGYAKVTAHTDDKPFWWRKFEDSIELSLKIKEIIERNEQRKGVNREN